MNTRDELDKLIKELSEKQESYKNSQTTSSDSLENLDFPELIPVDFDLSKELHEEAPVAVTEQIIEEPKQQGLFSRLKTSLLNLFNKKRDVSFNLGIKNLSSKIIAYAKQKPLMLVVITLVLLVIVGFGVFASGCSLFNSEDKMVTKALAPLNKQEENTNLIGSDRINILLLGIDSPDGKFDERSDTIILVSFDPKTRKISALSIPRDSYINIPGHGKDKINASNQFGGPELVIKTISNLLDVQIDHYAITNFNGFVKIIDTLGGVDLDVEKNMYYRTYNGTINLKKGMQHLDGDKALQYVRFRHDALGDISRTQRQQKFILTLAKEIMQPKTILKLPKLLPEIAKSVKTDLSVSEMVSLASAIKSFDLKNINTQTLPGNFVTMKGISYWYVDSEKAKQVVLDVFVGKTSDEIVDPNLRPKNADPVKPKKTEPKVQQPKDNSTVNNGTYKGAKTVNDKTYTKQTDTKTVPSDAYGNNSDPASNPQQGGNTTIPPVEGQEENKNPTDVQPNAPSNNETNTNADPNTNTGSQQPTSNQDPIPNTEQSTSQHVY